jgi:hypothetical protein
MILCIHLVNTLNNSVLDGMSKINDSFCFTGYGLLLLLKQKIFWIKSCVLPHNFIHTILTCSSILMSERKRCESQKIFYYYYQIIIL